MNDFFKSTAMVILLGCASLAHAAPIDPAVIRQAVRDTVREAPQNDVATAPGKRPDGPQAARQPAAASNDENIWARRIGLPGEHEGGDNCLLSFGFNGTLGGRSLSSHVLGTSQVWRDK